MAKSLRSKWRRKCRAVKRVRYGEKELARLKKTLGIDENAHADAEMSEIQEIATVTDAKEIKEKAAAKEKEKTETAQDTMEVEGARVFNKRTMRDQHGNYPVWMSRRKITKHKHARTKGKNAPTKQTKKKAKKPRNKGKK
ncbi:protein LLP homolog [Neodiprion virginianus]|uniref:protein LLP homolog n=1 Tax=Neodiprion virginianus TaxID=2961670 RepID=UPI001EE755A2|nr:protein LLP homolog [Neodiprion virginianus]XP_046607571.1 protein LLP homolog [Neodiprion virginianus]